MLFHSLEFLLLFLPLTWLGFQVLGHITPGQLPLAWLTLASLLFYADWHPPHLALLLGSILINFTLGRHIDRSRQAGAQAASRRTLILGLIFNLGLLAWFKYMDFLLETLGHPVMAILLPTGISFFTFQQIAFLVDNHHGRTREESLLRYTLFISFFPQLIAGPIVAHQELAHQFLHPTRESAWPRLGAGLTLFTLGLAKKVVVADGFGMAANLLFDTPREIAPLLEAWGGVMSYGFQIYFDFSAYSDMALGLGLLFGIRLPVNFASPYQATSLIDFWRRWHITLSRFLRDYLYIPLGGSRRGLSRQMLNLMATMTLGGLWHGAGWTFLLWGALHGLFLSINVAFRHLSGWRLPPWPARLLTFLCVTLAWVPFRARSLEEMNRVYQGLCGLGGFQPPSPEGVALIGAALALVWFFPNTQQWLASAHPGLPSPGYPATAPEAAARPWHPTPAMAVGIALCFVFSLVRLHDLSAFLYFQF